MRIFKVSEDHWRVNRFELGVMSRPDSHLRHPAFLVPSSFSSSSHRSTSSPIYCPLSPSTSRNFVAGLDNSGRHRSLMWNPWDQTCWRRSRDDVAYKGALRDAAGCMLNTGSGKFAAACIPNAGADELALACVISKGRWREPCCLLYWKDWMLDAMYHHQRCYHS